jgi:recombination protein RecA
MAKDLGGFIDELTKKTEHVYVPDGIVKWRLPTGILSIDKILGGGIPSGSITQLYGPEKSGKTTLAYQITGQAVKQGRVTLLVPLEKYSLEYAKACGIDTDAPNYHTFAADYAELTFNTIIEAVREYHTEVIVMDSISAATPKGDLDKPQKTDDMMKGFNIGTHARAIGDFITKLQLPLRRYNALFVTVNQLSNEIGRWGSSKKPKGGMALQYYSDIKFKMWGKDFSADNLIESTVTIEKDKDFEVIPFGSTVLYMSHGKGVDIERDLISYITEAGIVKKSGAWYSYVDLNKEEHKYQGMPAFADDLRNNTSLKDELMSKALESTVSVKTVPGETVEDVERSVD